MNRVFRIVTGCALCVVAGCGSDSSNTATPEDLISRLPNLSSLIPTLPGRAGADETGSAIAFEQLAAIQQHLAPISALNAFLSDGGNVDQDVALIIALEDTPHAADRTVRYTREADRTRLDVERLGDHRFYYMQYDDGSGFDPDNAITTAKMLIEGSTVQPTSFGQRSTIQQADGLADETEGYLRIYLTKRPQEQAAVHEALDSVQVDYDLGLEQQVVNLTYELRESVDSQDAPRALYHVRQTEGDGFIYFSAMDNTRPVYQWFVQYHDDGAMAVWQGDGTFWGCYEANGREVETTEDPDACAEFAGPFPHPPSMSGYWPGIPSGIPR